MVCMWRRPRRSSPSAALRREAGGLLGNLSSPSDGTGARTSRGNGPPERLRPSSVSTRPPRCYTGSGFRTTSKRATLAPQPGCPRASLRHVVAERRSSAAAPTPLRADWLHLHTLNQLFYHRGVTLTYMHARLPYKIDGNLQMGRFVRS